MIFVDSDILLDITFQREPFWQHAADLIDHCLTNQITMVTTPITLANIHYIVSKHKSEKIATSLNLKLLSILYFQSHEKEHFLQAYRSNFRDKEDAVNYFTARSAGAENIITRNKKDFNHSEIPVLTAGEYLLRKQ